MCKSTKGENMTHINSTPCAAIRVLRSNGETGIYFFDSSEDLDSYMNWLIAQPKEQWNILGVIHHVHQGTEEWESYHTFLQEREEQAWEENE